MKPLVKSFVKTILNRIFIVVISLLITTSFFTEFGFADCGFSDCGLNENNACYKDWIVSPETHPLCGGYFIELSPPHPNQRVVVLPNQPVTITALKGQFTPNGPSVLKGQVHLIQGNRQMLADEAKIYRNHKTDKLERIEASGHIQIAEPGIKLMAPFATLNMIDDTKTLDCAEYRLYNRNAHGEASHIIAFGKDRMILDQATYTTCNPYQNTWYLKAKKIKLNKETGRGQSYHTRMYMKNIPIFYLPYLNFPIDNRRQTGFLFPSISYSSQSGAEISTPFYWNIAPNYDATITPRLLSKRGIDFEVETRYLTSRHSGNVNGAILPYDRDYAKFRKRHLAHHPKIPNNDPRIKGLRKGSNTRKSLFARHTTTFNPNFLGRIDYQAVSDDNYLFDLGTNLNVANTTQLPRMAEFIYADWNNHALFRFQEFQTLHPFNGPITIDPYRRMPQFSFQNNLFDDESGLRWTATGDFTYFTHKNNPFTGLAHTTGGRGYLRPSLSYPMISPGWFLKPRIQGYFLAYSLSRSKFDQRFYHSKSPGLALPIVDIDSGLVFERPMQFCRLPLIQTLEPRAYYLWVPFRKQNAFPNFDSSLPGFNYNQLFRDNRFSGLDRIGDTNQITLALTSRLLIDETGAEKISGTIGQILYFQNRKVTLCDPKINYCCIKQELPDHKKRFSNYVAALRYHLFDAWSLNSTGQWNPNKSKVDEAAVWLQYQPNEFNVVNLGYLFLRHNPAQFDPRTGLPARLNQAETSFAYMMSENWRMLSRIQYDLRYHRVNEVLAGIEYQGCCTAVRLAMVRYLQPNDFFDKRKYRNGFQLQFIFKGLAGIGHNNLSSLLTRSIPGYHWQESHF